VSEELKPAYLIAGADEAKIDAVLARLRGRAEREGAGALETFAPADGQGPPDPEALLAALPAMSLMAARRYLLADGVESWSPKQAGQVAEGLEDIPPETTVVLVARLDPGASARGRDRVKRALAPLARAVEAAGGESVTYEAPRGRQLPEWVAAEARRRGFTLAPDAARLLIERMGENTLRLRHELDRLALWVEGEAEVSAADLAAMVADTSEEAAWALSDAIVSRDASNALQIAERLATQGESVTPLVYQAAKRLREARALLAALETGGSERDAASSLRMHPYAAKMLARRVRDASPEDLRAATCAVADLEWWTRGGAEYPEEVALTLALRRAARAGAGGR
jgi:DNA polymerase III delta subunit